MHSIYSFFRGIIKRERAYTVMEISRSLKVEESAENCWSLFSGVVRNVSCHSGTSHLWGEFDDIDLFLREKGLLGKYRNFTSQKMYKVVHI